MTHPDEHECFSRGCHELVVGRYHCDRHQAILERQRAARGRRNSESAAKRRELSLLGFYGESAQECLAVTVQATPGVPSIAKEAP